MYVLFKVLAGDSRKIVAVFSGGIEVVISCLTKKLPGCEFHEFGKDGFYRSSPAWSLELQPAPYCEPRFCDGSGFAKLEELLDEVRERNAQVAC
jgi:hypothetical protein